MAYTNIQPGWKMKKITATGQALGKGEVFGGLVMSVAGTSTTISAHDDTAANAGSLFIPTTAALTAGQYVSPVGGVAPITTDRALSEGVIMSVGLWLVVGGTGSPVFWVLYK